MDRDGDASKETGEGRRSGEEGGVEKHRDDVDGADCDESTAAREGVGAGGSSGDTGDVGDAGSAGDGGDAGDVGNTDDSGNTGNADDAGNAGAGEATLRDSRSL